MQTLMNKFENAKTLEEVAVYEKELHDRTNEEWSKLFTSMLITELLIEEGRTRA